MRRYHTEKYTVYREEKMKEKKQEGKRGQEEGDWLAVRKVELFIERRKEKEGRRLFHGVG